MLPFYEDLSREHSYRNDMRFLRMLHTQEASMILPLSHFALSPSGRHMRAGAKRKWEWTVKGGKEREKVGAYVCVRSMVTVLFNRDTFVKRRLRNSEPLHPPEEDPPEEDCNH